MDQNLGYLASTSHRDCEHLPNDQVFHSDDKGFESLDCASSAAVIFFTVVFTGSFAIIFPSVPV